MLPIWYFSFYILLKQVFLHGVYSQRTFTQAAYESNLANPKITVISYGTIEKIDQFGNPWEDWMDAPGGAADESLAKPPEVFGPPKPPEVYGTPKPPEINKSKHTIEPMTPERERQYEQRKKEWEESPFANNSGIDNAVLYAEMPKAERDALERVLKFIAPSCTPHFSA